MASGPIDWDPIYTAASNDLRRVLLVIDVALRLRLPAKQPASFAQVPLLSGVVSSHIHGLETTMPLLDDPQRRGVGACQILFVGDIEIWMSVRSKHGAPSIVQVLLTPTRPGESQRDDIHVEPSAEVRARP